MFDLFGSEMPLAVRFFLAFLVVLGLIGVTAWAVRRFGAGRLNGANARGRQPRLGVVDFASVDARRRLILVRRDNVEHLVMIGGPTDVLVESNIVRAVPAAGRDLAPARSGAEMPRAMPLPDLIGGEDTAGAEPLRGHAQWPQHPEPVIAPRRARVEPHIDEPPSYAAEAPRPSREALAALADDLAAHNVPQPRSRSVAAPRALQAEARHEPRAAAPPPGSDAAADQNLAEMAQRLEAALRAKPRPMPEPQSEPAEEFESEVPPLAPPLPSRAPRPAEPRVARSEPRVPEPRPEPRAEPRSAEARPVAKTGDPRTKDGKTLYDSLEQEMASLLGRPTGKT
jgi:hypothetical protein